MAVTNDLLIIGQQERELAFAKFDEGDAWKLGQSLREWGLANGGPIAIDVRTFNRPLFFVALPGSPPDNIDMIRRKSNVVNRYRRSSYAIGLEMIAKSATLVERYALPLRDYAPYGGAFPIILKKSGVVGSVTVTGTDERQDHMLVVTAICEILGMDIGPYALTVKSDDIATEVQSDHRSL
ncbi:heme-degrading domain-containing protein [Komagataeibacter diospyri]|uniref:heme-degrading domain-containing protein n=1 Tax=Komagataeibacter diospyri TaxID=1932662 RepID=UPI003756911D